MILQSIPLFTNTEILFCILQIQKFLSHKFCNIIALIAPQSNVCVGKLFYAHAANGLADNQYCNMRYSNSNDILLQLHNYSTKIKINIKIYAK